MKKNKLFVSIIWGYFPHMYQFAPEENYHFHVLDVARKMGYKLVVLIRQGEGLIQKDPLFQDDITVIDYKNIFHYLYQVIRFTIKGAVFYVNSIEPQSLIIPFVSRKAVFFSHTHPVRKTKLKQAFFNTIMRVFSRIRLNNNEEKMFLSEQGVRTNKLFVVPLAISTEKYRFENDYSIRKDLVCFGNITLKKNLPTVIKAFEIILMSKPETKLHIVGQMLEDNISQMIKSNGLEKNILFHDFLPLEKVCETLNKFSIYINSSFDEGQCVAVYNAALSGCALCLPEIMSFRGVFKEKALFHESVAHEKLAENILHYLNNPAMIRAHNQSAREMIIRDYNYNRISQDLTSLFVY